MGIPLISAKSAEMDWARWIQARREQKKQKRDSQWLPRFSLSREEKLLIDA
jgi:hypothetical protein